MPVETHQINVQGLSGGIFWCALLAVVFYLVGFSTPGWSKNAQSWTGLWMQCYSQSISFNSDWFTAVQAMAAIGLIFLFLSLIFVFIYMFLHFVSVSKSLLLKLFVACSAISFFCILIALSIWGSKQSHYLHWSYALSAIGCIFIFIGTVLGCVQMKRASII